MDSNDLTFTGALLWEPNYFAANGDKSAMAFISLNVAYELGSERVDVSVFDEELAEIVRADLQKRTKVSVTGRLRTAKRDIKNKSGKVVATLPLTSFIASGIEVLSGGKLAECDPHAEALAAMDREAAVA